MLVNRDTPREKSQAEFGRWCGMVKKGGRDFGAREIFPQVGKLGAGEIRAFSCTQYVPPQKPPRTPKIPLLIKGFKLVQVWIFCKIGYRCLYSQLLRGPRPPPGGRARGEFPGGRRGGPGGPFLPFFRGEGKIREIAIYEHFPQTQTIKMDNTN